MTQTAFLFVNYKPISSAIQFVNTFELIRLGYIQWRCTDKKKEYRYTKTTYMSFDTSISTSNLGHFAPISHSHQSIVGSINRV